MRLNYSFGLLLWLLAILSLAPKTPLPFSNLNADIKSSGNIDFYINSNTSPSMRVRDSGLTIGSSQSSANLYVSGNVILSTGLKVGSVGSSASNLQIAGSMGVYPQSISSNSILDNYSAWIVSSNTNLDLSMPYLGNVQGRKILVKQGTGNGNIIISADNIGIDGSPEIKLLSSIHSWPSVQFIAGTNRWHILSQYGDIEKPIASTNLIGWWPLDEKGGSPFAYDSGSSGENGVHNNFANVNIGVNGVFNKSVLFDGVDDYIQVVDNSQAFNLQSEAMTLMCWVNLSSLPSASGNAFHVIYKQQYTLWIDTADRLRGSFVGLSDSYTSLSTTSLTVGTWYHCAIRYDGSTIQAYLNGKIESSESSTGSINDSSAMDLYIGRPAYYMHGMIDDVRLYNKALAAEHIKEIYRTGL